MFRRRPFRSRSRFLPAVRAAAAVALIGGGVATVASPAQAQNPSLDVRITTGPTSRTTGGLVTAVSVVNTGNEPLANVQMVVRVPAAPAILQNVTEASSPLIESSINKAGVIDERTGFWYHTVASIPVGGSAHFNVNWYNPCVGRWPFAARAGDRRTFVSFQFSGGSLPSCGLDDVVSPTPAQWFELPWPPSAPATTTTTSTSSTTSTTVVGGATLLPTVPGPTVAGAPTTVLPGAPPVTAAPAIPSTKPATTSTKSKPTTTRRPATTLEIVCKTVGGRRYCGPKSSALKPGQAKPRAVPPTTKKKTKK